jgi:DNA-binding PadR family transcriptional regulator
MKLTYPTALVLEALASGFHHGFDVMDATGLPSGTVYPILRRLDAEGLVRSSWEAAARAREAKRPPRRYYELTAGGRTLAREAIARFRDHAHVQRGSGPRRPQEA